MIKWRSVAISMAFVAVSSTGFAAGPPGVDSAPAAAATPASPAAQVLPKVCVDAQSGDTLTETFAIRLREAITASGTLSLGSRIDACALQLHVPGNLLRFETAGDVMVSTVVIVTSSSDRYLSTSISACRATDLKPCAVRAVTAAKLALLMGTDGAS